MTQSKAYIETKERELRTRDLITKCISAVRESKSIM